MTAIQARARLKTVPHWTMRARQISRTFTFERFPDSVDFVNRISRKAERSHHHPDIDIRYNRVKLTLTTHDEGGLTGKDFSLARECDAVFERYYG